MIHEDPRFSRWLRVQAYKHDGSLHRQWSPAFCVEETDDYWAIASRSNLVTESDGRKWITKENAVFLLFKKKWMNVIAMFKEDSGICYYVNIASPTIWDKGFLKYIDSDLDLKLYPDGVEKTLDEREYAMHVNTYGYTAELKTAIDKAMNEAKAMIAKREFPFLDKEIERLINIFHEENRPFEPHKK